MTHAVGEHCVLSTSQASDYIGYKPQTLRKWRLEGRGPKYCRLGSSLKARVVYRLKDIEDYLDSHSFASTTEETVAQGQSLTTRQEAN